MRQSDGAIRCRGFDLGIEPQLCSCRARPFREERHDVLPVYAMRASLSPPAQYNFATGVYGIAAIDLHSSREDPIQQPEARKHARHIVVNGDAVTFTTQRGAPLVHANAPAALCQSDGGYEAAESDPYDLSAARRHSAAKLFPPRRRRRCIRRLPQDPPG